MAIIFVDSRAWRFAHLSRLFNLPRGEKCLRYVPSDSIGFRAGALKSS